MKVIKNNTIPFGNFAAINLFGFLFVRNGIKITDRLLNHEEIHSYQMKEMWYIPFYIWYIIEWSYNLFKYRNITKAYYNIKFEKEAYANEKNYNYLNERRKFAWQSY